VHPHLPGDVREHLVPVLELDRNMAFGQRLDDRSLDQDRVVLGLCQGSFTTYSRSRAATRAQNPQPHVGRGGLLGNRNARPRRARAQGRPIRLHAPSGQWKSKFRPRRSLTKSCGGPGAVLASP
jgi:hypothetical protein